MPLSILLIFLMLYVSSLLTYSRHDFFFWGKWLWTCSSLLKKFIYTFRILASYCASHILLPSFWQYFGQTFIHDASKMQASPPEYIDPYAMLEDERISQMAPPVKWKGKHLFPVAPFGITLSPLPCQCCHLSFPLYVNPPYLERTLLHRKDLQWWLLQQFTALKLLDNVKSSSILQDVVITCDSIQCLMAKIPRSSADLFWLLNFFSLLLVSSADYMFLDIIILHSPDEVGVTWSLADTHVAWQQDSCTFTISRSGYRILPAAVINGNCICGKFEFKCQHTWDT